MSLPSPCAAAMAAFLIAATSAVAIAGDGNARTSGGSFWVGHSEPVRPPAKTPVRRAPRSDGATVTTLPDGGTQTTWGDTSVVVHGSVMVEGAAGSGRLR